MSKEIKYGCEVYDKQLNEITSLFKWSNMEKMILSAYNNPKAHYIKVTKEKETFEYNILTKEAKSKRTIEEKENV